MMLEDVSIILTDKELPMIKIRHSGNFNLTERFMKSAIKFNPKAILEKYASQGVSALAAATPKDSGVTASSWDYVITSSTKRGTITWTNSSSDDGIPVVVLIQYGHGTGSGSYVQGRDFINPAIKPILDKIAKDLWEEVIKL
jgi:hypothetical protein